ncbi:hypothetical protein CVT25_014037 [Psilocybe cyanescens]|uniref:Uncharacterized protein n=1 Tax=Psilocybe cyanescens TaxID=93625 RepID=A0A409XJX2_PSICY|nr:hypothetical protein CVT25_014037 [Psilocybe cyanescens]
MRGRGGGGHGGRKRQAQGRGGRGDADGVIYGEGGKVGVGEDYECVAVTVGSGMSGAIDMDEECL